jgi:hypothetical protein
VFHATVVIGRGGAPGGWVGRNIPTLDYLSR